MELNESLQGAAPLGHASARYAGCAPKERRRRLSGAVLRSEAFPVLRAAAVVESAAVKREPLPTDNPTYPVLHRQAFPVLRARSGGERQR